MPESMTLIEQANVFKKINHKNLIFNRIPSKQNIDIYSSQHFISSPPKQTKHHPSEILILPSIDKDDHGPRKKFNRPIYRTSLYHHNSKNSNRKDLSLLAARGKKPALTTIRDDDIMRNLQSHHAPPPSPSDDHIERLLAEFSRNRQYTPQLPTKKDDYIPYRLPALSQTAKRSDTVLNIPPKDIKSTFSNYLQTFY